MPIFNSKKKEYLGPIVGEWMWASTIDEAGAEGADKIMERAANAGVTDIYLMVKGTGGRLYYYNTKYTESRVTDSCDVLQIALKAAHARGIRLHAWICNMRDVIYKEAHPEACMWPYVRDSRTHRIDPRDAGYRDYMISIIRELAAYDIDGIHLDYMRYKNFESGWGDGDFAAVAELGADIARVRELIEATAGYNGHSSDPSYVVNAYEAGDPDAFIVGEYRRENIKAYASALVSAAREAKPSLIVSSAIMPEGAYDHAYADLHFGQNHVDAVELYDYICPMAYSTDLAKDADWAAEVAVADAKLGARVVVGLQAYNTASAETVYSEAESIKALTRKLRYHGRVLGYAFFRNASYDYSTIRENEDGTCSATLESATAQRWQSIRLLAQGEARILSVKAANGVAEGVEIELSPDGKLAEVKGEDISPDGLCSFEVITEGGAEGKAPVLLSPEGAHHICVYNIFRPFESTDKQSKGRSYLLPVALAATGVAVAASLALVFVRKSKRGK